MKKKVRTIKPSYWKTARKKPENARILNTRKKVLTLLGYARKKYPHILSFDRFLEVMNKATKKEAKNNSFTKVFKEQPKEEQRYAIKRYYEKILKQIEARLKKERKEIKVNQITEEKILKLWWNFGYTNINVIAEKSHTTVPEVLFVLEKHISLVVKRLKSSES